MQNQEPKEVKEITFYRHLLSVDDTYQQDYNDCMWQPESALKEKDRFKDYLENPRTKPLEALRKISSEITDIDNLKHAIQIIEVWSVCYYQTIQDEIEKEKNGDIFWSEVLEILDDYLRNILEDLKGEQADQIFKINVTQKAKEFLEILKNGGYDWKILPVFKKFIEKQDKEYNLHSKLIQKFKDQNQKFLQKSKSIQKSPNKQYKGKWNNQKAKKD